MIGSVFWPRQWLRDANCHHFLNPMSRSMVGYSHVFPSCRTAPTTFRSWRHYTCTAGIRCVINNNRLASKLAYAKYFLILPVEVFRSMQVQKFPALYCRPIADDTIHADLPTLRLQQNNGLGLTTFTAAVTNFCAEITKA